MVKGAGETCVHSYIYQNDRDNSLKPYRNVLYTHALYRNGTQQLQNRVTKSVATIAAMQHIISYKPIPQHEFDGAHAPSLEKT